MKFRTWLGFQGAKEKSRLEGTFGKQKGTTQLLFIANTLKATYKEDILKDKNVYAQLKYLAKRAYKNFKAGHFVVSEVFAESKKYRTAMQKAPHPVAVAFYQWYLQLPARQRKTRRLFYDQIAVLNGELPKDSDVPIDVSNRKRRGWLSKLGKRFNVSFRKTNKKFKLKLEERERRLGKLWRDVIRVRRGLAKNGNVPMQSWDQTPLWEDSLTNEETAVSKGAYKVAVNACHEASRKKYIAVLSMTSVQGYPAAPEMVIFAFHGGGKRITKGLEDEIANSDVKGAKFLGTPSGNTGRYDAFATCIKRKHPIH